MKNTIKGDQNGQICDFGLKIVIFGPFQSILCKERNYFPSKLGSKSFLDCPLGVKVQNQHDKYNQGDPNGQICDFGLKTVIFGPFQTLSLRGEKSLTFQTWLKSFLDRPLGVKVQNQYEKYNQGGKNGKTCDFCLKIVIFGPFQSPPPARGNNFDLPNLT